VVIGRNGGGRDGGVHFWSLVEVRTYSINYYVYQTTALNQ